MQQSWLDFLLRMAICLSFTWPGQLMAASNPAKPTTPQTQTGGGGVPPKGPTSLPTTYKGGGDNDGQDNNKKNDDNKNEKARTGRFGEVWGVDQGGKNIYYEGQTDSNGRSRVWTYSSNPQFVKRGVVFPDAAKPDGVAIRWNRGHDYYRSMVKELEYPPKPKVETAKPTSAPSAKPSPTGNLVDRVRVQSENGKGVEVAYFQGRQDARGRELLFRPHVINGQSNLQFYDVGFLEGTTAVWQTNPVAHDDLVKELESEKIEKRKGWSEKDRELFRERLGRLRAEHFKEWLSFQSNGKTIPEPAPKAEAKPVELPRPAPKLEPLPKNQALVTTSPGNNSTNSPYKESVGQPRQTFTNPGESPSELAETLEWQEAKTSRLGQWVERLRSGESLFGPRSLNGSSPLDPVLAEAKETAENKEPAKPGSQVTFTQTAIYFYAALGVAAAYTLMTDYPNNPTAWNSYADTLTDPIGYLSFGGFVLFAAPFYKRLDGAPFMRQVPLFAAALTAGSLASTAISVYGNDPDFRKCAGFAAYVLTGKFDRSMESCNKLFQKWTTGSYQRAMLEEITTRFLPMAANIAVTGTLFLGALKGSQFLINRSAWVNALRTVAVAKTPRSGFGTVVMSVGQLALFLGAYKLTDMAFGTEKGTREGLLAGDGLLSTPYNYFFNNENGANINDAENKLFAEWSRLKKSNFVAEKPDDVPLEKILDRYGKLLGSWRATQMGDTMAAYQEWNRKSTDFNTMLSTSYRFYKNSLNQIENQPGQKPFSYQSLRDNLGGQEVFVSAQENTWKYVATYRMEEFLLTSMACGPEVEGVGVRSAWDRFRQFTKSWITGNTRPDQIINNRTGRSMLFYPPRITKVLPGTLDTVCEHRGDKWLFDVLPTLPNPMEAISAIPSRVDSIGFYEGGVYYRGLIDYIKANIRESVWPGGFASDNLERWWRENVIPDAIKVRDQLREDYRKMLETTYKPALENPDYYWCEAGAGTTSGLDKYLRPLGGDPAACAPGKLHRLAKGALNSLRDEFRLYLAMELDLMMSERNQVLAEAANFKDSEALETAKSLVQSFDAIVTGFKEVRPESRGDLLSLRDQFASDLQKFDQMVKPEAADSAYSVRMARQLLTKLTTLFGDASNYYSILVKFDGREWENHELKAAQEP